MANIDITADLAFKELLRICKSDHETYKKAKEVWAADWEPTEWTKEQQGKMMARRPKNTMFK